QVSNARLAVLQAQTNIANANASLTRLVGTPYVVTAGTDDGEPAEAPAPLDSATLARLAADAPAVRQAQASLAAARASVRSARTAYWPTVSTSYSYSSNQSSSGFEAGNLWLLTGQNPNRKQFSLNL